MEKTADVVIIGGGIIGLSIAYHLARKRAGKVVLLEKGLIGEGSTSRCAGGIRTQFSTEVNILFSIESISTFENFRDEFGIDPGFKKIGYLFLACSDAAREVFVRNVELQRKFGLPVELLDREEVSYRWPYLRLDDIICATYCPLDGYAGPHEVISGFAKGAKMAGVVIHEKTEVVGILKHGRRVEGVATSSGDIHSHVVVNAAGPYASIVGRMAGLEIPVAPVRRQLFVTDPLHIFDGIIPLTIDFERGWYFRPEIGGFLISGGVDKTSSYNLNVDYDGMVVASENAIYRVPCLEKARIRRGWAGLYEISPDNHAIVGGVPELEGFILANGFSGHGFQHSPAVGKVIAELIVHGKAVTIDISSLTLDRFAKGQSIKESMTAFWNETNVFRRMPKHRADQEIKT